MTIYKYEDLAQMDINAIKNPMLLTPKNSTYKLLRHTGIKSIAKWAQEHGLDNEILLAMRIIAVQIEAEYRKIKQTEGLISK